MVGLILGVTPVQFLPGFRSPKDCVNSKNSKARYIFTFLFHIFDN